MAAFDASSIAPLGTLLGGGGPNLENAYEEGRYRSAQTEQAIQSAAVAQQTAIKQKQTNDSITAFKANNPDLAHLTNDQLVAAVTGGLGSDLSAVQTSQDTALKNNLRNTVSSPLADALTRTRAAQGLDPGLQDVRPFGEHGYINVAKGDTAPTSLGNEFAPPSDAIKNYNEAVSLGGVGAPKPGAQGFTPFVRGPQIVDLAGIRSSVDSLNPTAPPKALTDIKTVADNKAAVAAATTTATDSAKKTVDRQFDFPTAQARLGSADQAYDKMISTAQQVRNDPQLWQATGPGDVISKIPGTPGADIRAKIKILKSQAVLGAINQLRDDSKTGAGIGRITNAELPLLQNKMAALDATQSVGAFQKQLDDFIASAQQSRGRIHATFNSTYPEAAQPTAPAGGPKAPATVKSDADYNALSSGDTFIAPDGTTRTKP